MTNLTIGRVGLDVDIDEVSDLNWEGSTLVIKGRTPRAGDPDVITKQLIGYVDMADEEFVPVTFADVPVIDGFYRVLSVEVDADSELHPFGAVDFDVELERVQDSAAPVVELVVSGGSRSAESQVITNWFKNPFFDGAGAPVAESGTSSVGITGGRARAVASGAGLASMRLQPNEDRPVAVVGEHWWAVLTVYNGAGSSRDFSVNVRFYDSTGATLGSVVGAVTTGLFTMAGSASSVISINGATPSGAASAGLVVNRLTGSVSDVFEADSVYLGKSDPALLDVSPTVFSGATSNSYPATHAWTGTTNASASTRTLALTALNGRIAIPGDAVSLVTIDRSNTVASPTILSVALEDGTVRRFDTPADSFRAQFTLPADSFYDGSATLEAGDPLAVVTGRQVGNTPDDWLLSNGCFEIRPVAGVAMAFEMREWFSSAWGDWQTVTLNAQRDPAFSGNILNPHTFTVLRNSPECVTIRLSAKHSYTTGAFFNEAPVTVDISLRRGARAVSIEMKTAVIAYMTVAVEGFSAASPVNHGWYLASSRAFIRSPQVLNAVSGSPSLVRTPSTATRLSVGVGFSVTPAASKPAGTEFEYDYYVWAGSERQRVVAR